MDADDASCAFDPLASPALNHALTSGMQGARMVDEWMPGEIGLDAPNAG